MAKATVHLPPRNSFKVLEENFLSFFKPKPIPMHLVRVGGNRDGAYLVPEDFTGVDACFSPGVATYKSFEDELANTWRIRSHMVDFSARIEDFQTPLIHGMQTFSAVWLRRQTSVDSISLGDWILNSEPHATGDFLLQMDIEGGEYEVIESSPPELLDRFRILVIEFHQVRTEIISRREQAPIFKVVEKLSPRFVVAHIHPNNCEGLKSLPGGRALIPEVMEVTFIREDRIAERLLRVSGRNPRIPHPLDIDRNALHRRPVFLDSSWSSTSAFVLSIPRRIYENFRFFVNVKVEVWTRKLRRKLTGVIDYFYLRLGLKGLKEKRS